MSKYQKPQDVLAVIRSTDDAARFQGENRAKIQNTANGVPPLTDSEARKAGIRINVEWGELATLLAHARRQYETAVFGMQNFFKVTLPYAPQEKKDMWGAVLTQEANRILKRSDQYDHLKRSQIAALVTHGIGPILWSDRDDWCPELIAIEDLRIATDTETSFRNLEWFAVRYAYTVSELTEKAFGANSMPGWNKAAVRAVLKHVKTQQFQDVGYDWETAPEKMAELIKQNSGYFSSDAVPTVSLWSFYYKDGKEWFLCVVPEKETPVGMPQDEFVFKSDKPVTKDLKRLLQCQYGDLNCKAPFLFHSVRSLGFLLIEPCFYLNLTRCRLLQHVHEDMNVWYRVNDPTGRARATKIELYDKAVIPEGVSVVPESERHQINGDLLMATMANITQLKNEAAVTYTQQLDTGTQKEQTATETMANVHRVNAMMEGLLSRWGRSSAVEYREEMRRLCRKNTTNDDAKAFQEKCKRLGVPPQFMDIEQMDIEPEMPLGNGNPTMAMAKANQLLQMRPMYPPTAQQEILHKATVVFAGPREAAAWAPIDQKKTVSDAVTFAELAFGTLMTGTLIAYKEGLNPAEQIETLLALMAGKISGIMQQKGGMAEMSEVVGLETVAQYIGQAMQLLAMNDQEKQRVRQYGDSLSALLNELKGMKQRLLEQQSKSNGQMDPAVMAKIQGGMLKTQVDAKIKEGKARQQMAHKEMSFRMDERRKDQQAIGEMARANAHTATQLQNEQMKAESEMNQTPQE